MRKIIRQVDEKRGIVQITVADDRWYLKPIENKETGIPEFVPVPSVTWIAGFWPKGIGFYKWLADKGWDEAEAVKSAAGDKGSAVHNAVDMIIQGLEFRIDTKVPDYNKGTETEPQMRELTYEELKCVISFLDWKKEVEETYIIETLENDYTLYSEIHNFGGTLDWFVKLTDKSTLETKYYIIDFKTSKQVWKEHEIQINAYKRAVENGENPIHVKNPNGTETKELVDVTNVKMAILQLGYNLNRKGFKFIEIEDQFDLFTLAQNLWKAEVKEGTPGFTRKDIPFILSPKRELPTVNEEKVEPPLSKTTKTTKVKENVKTEPRTA